MAMYGDQDPDRRRRERPDTLVGRERANALRQLSRLGMDTTSFNQAGLERLFGGPFMDSLSSVREHLVEGQSANKPSGPLTYRTEANPRYDVSGYVDPSDDPSEIVLNLVSPFLPQTDAPMAFTETQWNEKPEDIARRVLLHEAYHTRSAAPADSRGGMFEEGAAELFQTAFDVLAQAKPEYTRQDYVDLFNKEFDKYKTAYRGEYAEGSGSREDPLRSPSPAPRNQFYRQMILDYLDLVSQADVFKDNPYRTAKDPTFLEKISDLLRGIRGG